MTAFLTKKQFAAELQISVRQLNRLIDAGGVRAVKIGSRLRIPAAELHRLDAEAASGGDGQGTSE